MSRNNQIEEMAKIIAQSVDVETLCDGLAGDSSMACFGCDYSEKEYCKHHLESATGLYNKGYRKASEGKWKPYKDYFTHRQVGWICSNCSSVTQDLSNGDTDYCPHCGSVMETESEGADDE